MKKSFVLFLFIRFHLNPQRWDYFAEKPQCDIIISSHSREVKNNIQKVKAMEKGKNTSGYSPRWLVSEN
jgi:hypothetical protein